MIGLTFAVLCLVVLAACVVAVARNLHRLPSDLRAPLLSAMIVLWLVGWGVLMAVSAAHQ